MTDETMDAKVARLEKEKAEGLLIFSEHGKRLGEMTLRAEAAEAESLRWMALCSQMSERADKAEKRAELLAQRERDWLALLREAREAVARVVNARPCGVPDPACKCSVCEANALLTKLAAREGT